MNAAAAAVTLGNLRLLGAAQFTGGGGIPLGDPRVFAVGSSRQKIAVLFFLFLRLDPARTRKELGIFFGENMTNAEIASIKAASVKWLQSIQADADLPIVRKSDFLSAPKSPALFYALSMHVVRVHAAALHSSMGAAAPLILAALPRRETLCDDVPDAEAARSPLDIQIGAAERLLAARVQLVVKEAAALRRERQAHTEAIASVVDTARGTAAHLETLRRARKRAQQEGDASVQEELGMSSTEALHQTLAALQELREATPGTGGARAAETGALLDFTLQQQDAPPDECKSVSLEPLCRKDAPATLEAATQGLSRALSRVRAACEKLPRTDEPEDTAEPTTGSSESLPAHMARLSALRALSCSLDARLSSLRAAIERARAAPRPSAPAESGGRRVTFKTPSAPDRGRFAFPALTPTPAPPVFGLSTPGPQDAQRLRAQLGVLGATPAITAHVPSPDSPPSFGSESPTPPPNDLGQPTAAEEIPTPQIGDLPPPAPATPFAVPDAVSVPILTFDPVTPLEGERGPLSIVEGDGLNGVDDDEYLRQLGLRD
eukprot:gnl/Chilomastix_cuspidata/2356.p1 GENE.gnl/Chilomastix_cuspidata/2356~~gnl/Chilomastix_cuspidata/2356.p1  ORF type:complete len:548 (+),score=173.59 gnl/Chilomastix_cuspidata/2356:582-2225(+)